MLYAFKLGRKLRGEEPYCPEKGGKGGSSDKSAKYAAEAQKYAADLQNQQWQTIMKNLAPFTPLAEQYVNQLQNLSSLEGQGQALNQYYNSQQYKDLAGQARYGTAMNPATTGAAVSYGLLTRAYESEPFRNAMLRMANTPRGSTAFEKAMQQAQKAINALTQGAKSDALSE
ncbi:TPA: hypothetical protein KWI49_001972 [Escherichia coli]|nr:hypothetical protein [Escherichia coli]